MFFVVLLKSPRFSSFKPHCQSPGEKSRTPVDNPDFQTQNMGSFILVTRSQGIMPTFFIEVYL